MIHAIFLATICTACGYPIAVSALADMKRLNIPFRTWLSVSLIFIPGAILFGSGVLLFFLVFLKWILS
jgi:hypothetical protein